ncbi:MAG TPA: hypothetical protein VFV94_13690 [Polyangiaceae bacterium]|nr:hypothetical protein [Polyangiaceae bacterium]
MKLQAKRAVVKNGWKTCSRGHKYRGSVCLTCWPGGKKPRAK